MLFSNYIKPNKQERITDPFAIQVGKIKEGVVQSSYRKEWAEDVYISDGKERATVGKSFDFSKIPFIGFILIFFVSILVGRTAWMQIVKADYYYAMAEGNRIRIERIEPKRGVIYDRNLNALVGNRANFLLYFIPADLPESKDEVDKIIDKISSILGGDLDINAIKEKLSKIKKRSLESYQPIFVTDNIEYEKAMKVYLEASNWSGVVLTSKSNREYMYTGVPIELNDKKDIGYLMSLSHILGYTGKINDQELAKFGEEYLPIDYIGKMGIEYFWENELKGYSGKKQIEVDALGKEKKIIGQKEAEDGNNLVLSLDTQAQLKLEEILLKQLSKLKLNKASAVVLDPRNGEVLAMVSLPAYNNNVFSRGISQDEYGQLINHPDRPLYNRSISGEYPSGSTIKPVMSAAALQEGVITENTSFLSTGGIRIDQWFFPDWKAGGHGTVNVRKALAESVNTFFYYIGGGYEDFKGLGVDKIVEYFQLFGLGSQTGIDLAGEASGFVPTRDWKQEAKNERWYIGDTYHLSIGQGDLLVTPLQVAVFTSVFANEGKLYSPHFIRQVLSSKDQIIKEVSNEPVRQDFIDSYNVLVVKQGMRQTVTSGSARSMQSLPVAVAGKTGTAQWSSKKDNHAWFTGFAPYDNPELVITVLIEEGKEGSSVAVPVAKDFLNWYFGEYKPRVENKK